MKRRMIVEMNLYGDLPKSKNQEFDVEGSGAGAVWTEVAKAPTLPSSSPELVAQELPLPTKVDKLGPPPPSVVKKSKKSQILTEVSVGLREVEHVKYGFSLFGDLVDEYDPSKPNDYEEVMREKERRKQEAEMEAEKQEELKRELQEKERLEKERREKSGEEQEKEISHEHDVDDEACPAPTVPLPSAGEGKGMNLAQKLLEKYGWKEGEGLGKERQGIATPLIAQKTDNRSAVIVKAQQLTKLENAQQQVQIPPLIGSPTRVVLLRNLVGPGEVDDDLEDEVAQELQNYGQVNRVLIFEVTEENFPPEEAIRIFVELGTVEEAKKAANALHGRFFGGRIVRAGYFDEKKFDDCDLAPEPDEFTS